MQPAESSGAAGQVVIERPPPGLARGREPAPAWLIILLGALAVGIAAGFYLRKFLRKRPP